MLMVDQLFAPARFGMNDESFDEGRSKHKTSLWLGHFDDEEILIGLAT